MSFRLNINYCLRSVFHDEIALMSIFLKIIGSQKVLMAFLDSQWDNCHGSGKCEVWTKGGVTSRAVVATKYLKHWSKKERNQNVLISKFLPDKFVSPHIFSCQQLEMTGKKIHNWCQQNALFKRLMQFVKTE